MADNSTLIADLRKGQAKIRAEMAQKRDVVNATLQTAKRDELEKLAKQKHELIVKIHALTAEIDRAEQPVLHKTKMELAELARTDTSITQTIKSLGG